MVNMEFIASVDRLHKILEWIREQLKPMGLDRHAMHHIELASEEALVNIIHHAYKERPEKIEVQVKLLQNHAEMAFIDHGPPFNPLAAAPLNPNLSLEDREIGGLGIHFMRQCVDEMRYERVGKKNVLTFVIFHR